MEKRRTDVAIVGAGPTGMALAIGLAQRGVDFIIVDALPEAKNTSRAAVIHAATLDALGAIDVAERMIAQGRKLRQFRVRDRDRVLLHAEFAMLDGPTRHALMIPQDETEAILAERLRELGHSIVRPVTVSSVERVPGGARVNASGEGGGLEIEARYVVGADGAKSAVRTGIGIDFPGHTYGSFMLADVRMDWPVQGEEVSLFFSQQGTLVVGPMSHGRYRVVAQMPDAPSEPAAADVEAMLKERGLTAGTKVSELLWGSRFQVHHKLADAFRDGPVLLLGDAAHIHSPAGGQGMNLGLRDAVALAEALGHALRDGDDSALDAWAGARREAAKEVMRMTDRLTRVAAMKSPVARWLRNRAISLAAMFPGVRRHIVRTLSGYG